MADKLTYEEAQRLLDELPEYHWITRNEQSWWTAREVSRGLSLHINTVLDWLKNKLIPGAIESPGKWNIPRSALLIFLAKRHLRSLPNDQQTG